MGKLVLHWCPDGDAVIINHDAKVRVTLVAGLAASLSVNGYLALLTDKDILLSNRGFLTVNEGGAISFSENGQILGGGNGSDGILVTILDGASLATANLFGFNKGNANQLLGGSIAINPGNRNQPFYAPAVNYLFNGTNLQEMGTAVKQADKLTIGNPGSVMASNFLDVSEIELRPESVLDMGLYALAAGKVNHQGILFTQNDSAKPLPAGKNWMGKVVYNGDTDQTIVTGNYTDLDGAGGNRTLSPEGVIRIAGVFAAGEGNYTVKGSTVEFNGNDNQLIPTFTFYRLVISNQGNKKITAESTVVCKSVSVTNE